MNFEAITKTLKTDKNIPDNKDDIFFEGIYEKETGKFTIAIFDLTPKEGGDGVC